jgi:hypothetical protein
VRRRTCTGVNLHYPGPTGLGRDELATHVPRVIDVDRRNRVIDAAPAHLHTELTLTEPA